MSKDLILKFIFYMVFFSDIDALGKPGVGMMKGNLMWQGGFDECLEMKNTKYCYISKLKLMNNSKLVSEAVLIFVKAEIRQFYQIEICLSKVSNVELTLRYYSFSES